jgi:hypothetical protein
MKYPIPRETLANVLHDAPCNVCGEPRIVMCFVRTAGFNRPAAISTRLVTLCGCRAGSLREHILIRKI